MSIINYLYKIFNVFNSLNKILPTPPEKDNHDLTTYIRCMFHDLRGPLNNIFLGIDVVMSTIPKKCENYELLTTVKESCIFLNESLDGFLNIKAVNNKNLMETIVIKYEPFNIVGLINKVKHILIFNAIKKNIEIKCTVKKIKEWVIGDSKNIQHVIMNLLSNAIKFSSTNSTIQIELECIKIINAQQHILITILDDNPFIEPHIKAKLFVKYNTSDTTTGTGLGLYICKHIIELHKGTIHHHYKGDEKIYGSIKFETNINRGNIFQIQLFLEICASNETDVCFSTNSPENRQRLTGNQTGKGQNASSLLSPKQAKLAEDVGSNTNKIDMIKCIKNNNSISNSNNGRYIRNPFVLTKHMPVKREYVKNILKNQSNVTKTNIIVVNIMVIDDSDLSRKLLIKLIESNCHNIVVHSANDGLNALLKIIGFRDKLDQHISMIFVDNIMPHITGELLSKILRGIGYSGLIIGVTGNALESDKQSFFDNGADYVCIKPFTLAKLKQILEFIQREGFESVEETIIVEDAGKLKRIIRE